MESTQKGFTILEVLIAMVIFIIGIMGVIALQAISLVSADYSGNFSNARILATSQLDRLSALPFDDARVAPCPRQRGDFCRKDQGQGQAAPLGVSASNLDSQGRADQAGRFRREWRVNTLPPDGSGITVNQISVRVSWTDIPNMINNPAPFNRSLEMTTLKANGPI